MKHWSEEIEFVNEQIENKNYVVLPDTIAIGNVYKVPSFGSLDKEGYEVGYLYLPPGSGIKTHTHINDVERYKLLCGRLSINEKHSDTNICTLNNSHCIDVVLEPTVIQTCKVNRLYTDIEEELSSEFFDSIVYQEKNKNK